MRQMAGQLQLRDKMRLMRWTARLGLFAFGLFLMVIAALQLQAGHFVFDNISFHQTTFAAGGFGVGILFCGLAFLPPTKWTYKHISAKYHRMKRPRR
jgi:hypothetical protein